MKTTTIPQRPARERITEADIMPGDIIDGGLIGLPEYWRLAHLGRLPWIRQAGRHVAVDCGAVAARRSVTCLARAIRRIARAAERQGYYISIHAPDSHSFAGSTRDMATIRAVVWVCAGSRIIHTMVVEPRLDGSINSRPYGAGIPCHGFGATHRRASSLIPIANRIDTKGE